MEFKTLENWDEELWEKWREIYNEAFGESAKPEKIIRNMFQKHMCFFHIVKNESEVCGIALSGKLQGTRMLLIDYLAVRVKDRNRGIGKLMVDYIKCWALTNLNCEGIIIEVEAEKSTENLYRIQFWKRCGFILTEYIHHYKVVPEPYQAMFLKLIPDVIMPEEGPELFLYIEQFHRKSFRGA